MPWGIRESLCYAVGAALGLALMSSYELGWWVPVATFAATFGAMQVVR